MSEATLRITADWIIPLSDPPLRQGILEVVGHRIAGIVPRGIIPGDNVSLGESKGPGSVGPSAEASAGHFAGASGDRVAKASARVDYPGCAIVPGLINAHTHLELSGWPSPLTRLPLWDWIPQIVAFRQSPDYRPADTCVMGALAVLAGGACGLADIVPPDWFDWDGMHQDAVAAAQTTSARVENLQRLVFVELLAPTGELRGDAQTIIARHQAACHRRGWQCGISPHAPYTVPLPVLEHLVELACQFALPVAMHVAETAYEEALLWQETGPFAELLGKLPGYQPGVFGPRRSLADVLKILVQAPRVLLLHGNYLAESHLEFLSGFRHKLAIVYCPRSHLHFGHARYPLGKFLDASLPVIVGTDSRASHPDLSLHGDLQTVRQLYPELGGETILRMATAHAAQALGWDRELGTLSTGKEATFTVIEIGPTDADPYEAVLSPQSRVKAVWIAGKRCFERAAFCPDSLVKHC